MEYRLGNIGRVAVIRFNDHDDIIGGIKKLASDEGIRGAVFYLLGGIREGRIVVGPKTEELPPEPVWRGLGESHEMLGVGTVFFENDEPKIHLHGAFGKGDAVKVGCLRADSETFLVLEAVVMEINGINARRELDPATGLSLLRLS